MMTLTEFNALLGQNSYVRCRGKERQDPDIVDLKAAEAHLFAGGTIGWWVREGYMVVDIDEHADVALKVIKSLGIKTLQCRTPRGVHAYFKTDKVIPQKIKMMLPIGLKADVRVANKGYVMLPYGMEDRTFSKYSSVEDLPPCLSPMVGVTRETLVGLKDGDGRNDTLFRQLMDFKNRGGSVEDVTAVATAIDNIVFDQPMGEDEINKILKNVSKYEAKNTGDNPYILYNGKGYPSQINARAICDYFVNRGDIFALGGDCFQYTDGVYKEAASNVRNTIKEMIGEDSLITQDRLMGTYRLVIDDVRIHRTAGQLNPDKSLINLLGGMYDIQTGELLPHDSKYLSTLQIPHHIPTETLWEGTMLYNFLHYECELPDEDMGMLMRFMAYCLTLDFSLKTFMIFNGPSNTGKSVLIRFLERLVGMENTSNLSMHELSERFYPSLLKDKLINSCADNSSLPLESIENLKKITGGDQIMHEKKGKEPFFFTSFAKLIFSFNQLPLQLEEKSNAFYKRMRILYMNKELHLNDAYVNKLLSEDSVCEVLPHLLNLLPLSDMPNTPTSMRLVESLRQDSDSVHAFLRQRTKRDPVAIADKDDVYEAYQRFCITNGREAHKKQQFMRYMRASGVEDTRHPKTRAACWKGLKVKP